jgi:hypothetical protein
MKLIKWIKSLFKEYNIYKVDGKYVVKEGWYEYLSNINPDITWVDKTYLKKYCLVKTYAEALILIQKRKDYLNTLKIKKMGLV